MFPCGGTLPLASTLNSPDGRIKAAAAIVPAGRMETFVLSLPMTPSWCSTSMDISPDDGPEGPRLLPGGSLPPGGYTQCNRPIGRALSGRESLADLPASVEPLQPALGGTGLFAELHFGAQRTARIPHHFPNRSINNPCVHVNAPTGTVTANAAIVPAGANGSIDVFCHNSSDLVIDVNGYFAPPAANGLSLFTIKPCRVLDTETQPALRRSQGSI